MEVHAHSHIPKGREKKWTHYFWEFLMLFLAVIAGFFAENQREHFIEHKREKEYIKQLVEDLKHDTVSFSSALHANAINQRRIDSLVQLLKDYTIESKTVTHYYLARLITSKGISPQYSNRTFEQLKNSGGLRLIRKKQVLDSITLYYESLKELDIRLTHRLQRLHNLFLANEELFDGWKMTEIADSGYLIPAEAPPLLSSEKIMLSRYVLRLGYFKAADEGISETIRVGYLPAASRLITLLQAVYNLN